VELAFKLFKSDAKLETTLGTEKHRVQCEFYAKLIALLLFNRLCGVVQSLAGDKISAAKLWRRMRDEVADLRQILGQGTAQTLRQMLSLLRRYARPKAGKKHLSTLQGLERAARRARQVKLKDPGGDLLRKRVSRAEANKEFTRCLESHK